MRIVTHENFYGMKFLAKKYKRGKGKHSFQAITGLSSSTQSKLINSDTFAEYDGMYAKKTDDLNDGIAEFRRDDPENTMIGSTTLFIRERAKDAFWIGIAIMVWNLIIN